MAINKEEDINFSDVRETQPPAAQTMMKLQKVQQSTPLSVGCAWRILRNLLAHPAFNVSRLYFDTPELLLALSVELAKLKVRIRKSDGRLEAAEE